MFGSKSKELETLLYSVKQELKHTTDEKKKLEKELESTRIELKQLRDRIGGSDVSAYENKLQESIVEYEGLKKHFSEKIRAFDESKEKAEQEFADECARKQQDLENEITDTRLQTQESLSSTVGKFNETYSYYLSQIRVLMNALSQVMEKTGKNLFENDTEQLKLNFSRQLVEAVNAGAGSLSREDGEMIVIGTGEGIAEMPELQSEEPDDESVQEVLEALAEEEEAPPEIEIETKDFQKLVDAWSDPEGKFSPDLMNKDLLGPAYNSSRVRTMIREKAPLEEIRLYIVGSKFRNITGKKDMSDEEVLKMVELLDKVSPVGVLDGVTEYLQKKLE